MKQCPRCNRNYADEALSYCLEDGAMLVKKYDPEATLVTPYTPSPVVPPTVAYKPPPAVTPIQPPVFAPAVTAPPPRSRSGLLVGVLIVIALAVGLTIGGIIFQRSNTTTSASPAVSPAEDPVATHTTTPTPVPAATASTPAPPQTTTPASNSGKSTTAQDQECILYNDKNDKSVVRVRVNCDSRNCDNDVSTIAGEYPDNTPIRVSGDSVLGSRFTWVKVVITSSGQTVWVASSKIKCA